MAEKKTLVVVLGPTASGKTDVAIRLAKYFNTEIISADSRQFYHEIPIGTAAPTAQQLAAVSHHFVGNLSLNDDYNVSRFEQEVMALLKDKFRMHDLVILTGGSGLYIDAVCKGIDQLPDPDLAIRKELQERWQKMGVSALQQQLQQLDPEFYEQVDKKNPKRLMRALEVCLQTGRKYSEMRQNTPQMRDFRILKIGLNLPREQLYDRINQRTDLMMESGWLEEAKSVSSFRHLNALNTVGYKELFAYFDGKLTLEEAIEKIKTNTRRYAKRQLTWFRKDKDIHWFPPEEEKVIFQYVQSVLVNDSKMSDGRNYI